ncbi:MAG: Xaa-Pro aminopeptidase [Gammaproteobacteria bacterium]|nr:Xaa-Pro aminopeptidase [Gammaproteobacteria bacterium]
MNPKEFSKRRKQLMRMMGAGSVAIIPAAIAQSRNRDIEYPYRQDSDFQYLTGFPEPEAVAVLLPGRKQAEYVLFCRERDPEMEMWNGFRAGQDGACKVFGADDSFPISDIDDILPGMLEGCDRVFYTMGCMPEFDQKVLGWVNQIRSNSRSGSRPPGEFVSLEHLLHDMRLFKSRSEVSAMRKAAKISIEAHKQAMRVCAPGMMEYEVEAEFLHGFRKKGTEPAYTSIVGGGSNACILHYVSNNAELQDGDLLLIDAGAEVECYASDITRTFPVNGKFSSAQRDLYNLVLAAQKAAINKVEVGNHWNEPHLAAVKVITKGLVKLGILKGQPGKLIKEEAYKRFYMHRTGHWLGMDVHDVGDYKLDGEWRVLEPGMVLTVEPGIYIPSGSKGVAKKWWDIGIRIEDDVLVTRKGPDVLTDGLVKEVDEIESLMAGEA